MNVLVKQEHGGQLGPYQDSVYSGFITIERPELINGAIFYQEMTEQLVRGLARLLIHEWKDNPGTFDARLEKIEPIGPTPTMIEKAHPGWKPRQRSQWYVRIVQPYCD